MKPSFNFCFYEQFRLNIHTDSLYDDNLNKWIIGKYPYNENRPAKITQEYGRWMLGDSTEATLMSPYGGTIYVIIYGDADCAGVHQAFAPLLHTKVSPIHLVTCQKYTHCKLCLCMKREKSIFDTCNWWLLRSL